MNRKERLFAKRRAAGMCYTCGLNPPTNPTKPASRCQSCLDIRKKEDRSRYRDSAKRYYEKNRQLALDHYGHRCSCDDCPETREEFLEFDHVNTDGAEHRKIYGHDLAGWLVRHGFPTDYEIQVL